MAVRCSVQIVRYLPENYPNEGLVAKTDNMGNTPLHCLDDSFDSLEIARLLLENGAPVNAINNNGRSALHVVVAGLGNLAHVREFIQHGADPLDADEDGDTPFDLALATELDHILTVAYKDQLVEHEGNR